MTVCGVFLTRSKSWFWIALRLADSAWSKYITIEMAIANKTHKMNNEAFSVKLVMIRTHTSPCRIDCVNVCFCFFSIKVEGSKILTYRENLTRMKIPSDVLEHHFVSVCLSSSCIYLFALCILQIITFSAFTVTPERAEIIKRI